MWEQSQTHLVDCWAAGLFVIAKLVILIKLKIAKKLHEKHHNDQKIHSNGPALYLAEYILISDHEAILTSLTQLRHSFAAINTNFPVFNV